MAGQYDDLDGEDLASIVSAIESNSDEIGITSDNASDDNDDKGLEDTESTEDVTEGTDTEIEPDDGDIETDTEDTDEDEGENTQAEEDDVVEEEEGDLESDDEEELDDDTGVDDDVEEDELEDDDSTSGDDDEVIEGDEVNDELTEADEFYRQTQDIEYIVNGTKMKGLGTIEDMVKSRQMSGGLNEKFKAIKDAKPVLAPLRERGLITDPDKFNLLMQVADGDVEAHKELMRQQGIDPIDIDMDVTNYEAKNSVTSNEEIMYNDTLSIAKQYGVEEKFNKVVLNDWDSDSLNKFFESPESAATIGTALAEQIENGLYDEVMNEVTNLESLDVNGTFATKSSIDKYNEASNIVNQRNAGKYKAEPEVKPTDEVDTSKVEAAKKKIEEKRKEATYTKKLEEKNAQANARRKKASASSTKKTKVAPAKKADPYSLEGDDLDSFVSELMNTFR